MGDYNDALLRNPNAAVQARTKTQNRNNVMQLKLIGQSHPTGLTPNLLKLFEPRPPLEYKPAPEKRKCPPYTDKETNKPRGYAFIEYMHTRDMKAAYKQADGKKIDNRRALVDVERGRTVPNWRPRRLGGGLGTTRVGGEEINQRNLGREQSQSEVASRSEEPRIRDDQDRDREKSRERGREREKERERSRELSHDKPRDRDRRDDRHHRDRDRNREGDRERERDRDRRDRGRDRDRDRHHERERDRDRYYEVGDDHDQGRSCDRDYEYDRVDSKHEEVRDERERNYDRAETEDSRGWRKQTGQGHGYSLPEGDHDHGHYDHHEHQGRGQYDNPEVQGDYDRYKEADHYHNTHDLIDEDGYGYDRAISEPQHGDYYYRH